MRDGGFHGRPNIIFPERFAADEIRGTCPRIYVSTGAVMRWITVVWLLDRRIYGYEYASIVSEGVCSKCTGDMEKAIFINY